MQTKTPFRRMLPIFLSLLLCIGATGCIRAETAVARAVAQAVPFDFDGTGISLPDAMIGRLSTSRVLVVGEYHELQEHWTFLTALAQRLHPEGLRQIFLEIGPAEGVCIDGYIRGETNRKPTLTQSSMEVFVEFLAAFNEERRQAGRTEEQFRLRGIDIKTDHYEEAAALYRDEKEGLRHLTDTKREIESMYNSSIDPITDHEAFMERQVMRGLERLAPVETALVNVGMAHAQRENFFFPQEGHSFRYLARRLADRLGEKEVYDLGTAAFEVENLVHPDGSRNHYSVQADPSGKDLTGALRDAYHGQHVFSDHTALRWGNDPVTLQVYGYTADTLPDEWFDGILYYPRVVSRLHDPAPSGQ